MIPCSSNLSQGPSCLLNMVAVQLVFPCYLVDIFSSSRAVVILSYPVKGSSHSDALFVWIYVLSFMTGCFNYDVYGLTGL